MPNVIDWGQTNYFREERVSDPYDADPVVYIRRQWNDWRIAQVRMSHMSRLHWDTVSGGVRAPARQPFIHGYVICDTVVGDIAHRCLHGEGPHRIKVCVTKKDNAPAVYGRLLDIAGPKPK